MFVKFSYEVGFAGMDTYEIVELPDEDNNEDYLAELAWQGACDHAEMYGYYPYPEYHDGDEDENEDEDQYSDGIEGTWQIVDSLEG